MKRNRALTMNLKLHKIAQSLVFTEDDNEFGEKPCQDRGRQACQGKGLELVPSHSGVPPRPPRRTPASSLQTSEFLQG